jgi:hypothetical protein
VHKQHSVSAVPRLLEDKIFVRNTSLYRYLTAGSD